MAKIYSLLALCFLIPVSSNAQTPTAVPIEQSPGHRVLFENDYARVIESTSPPGNVGQLHTHSRDNVAVAVGQGRLEVQMADGSSTKIEVIPGMVQFARAPYSHRTINIGTTTVRIIDIEVIDSPLTANELGAEEYPRHALEIDNELVRVYRLTLDAHESIDAHQHALPVMSVTATGLRLIGRKNADGSGQTAEPGDHFWYPSGSVPVTVSMSVSITEVIEILWKARPDR